MSAHLIIQDGASPYWWCSPDIWVVPGSDPNGTPGQPIVGQPAYLCARVINTGQSAANGTRVDFYWANPSAQVMVGIATKIGSAFVDLKPGETQDVLFLVAWTPAWSTAGMSLQRTVQKLRFLPSAKADVKTHSPATVGQHTGGMHEHIAAG